MKKNILITIIVLIANITNVVFAQDNYAKIYYNDILIDNSGYSCKINNVVGLSTEIKFGLKISNATNSFMIYNPQESTFTINGKEVSITEKSKIIDPDKNKNWTINGVGVDMTKVKSFKFNFSGLYKITESEKAFKVDETKLPLAKNDFTFNNINCFVTIVEKSSKQTKLKVQIKNKSDQYLIVYPSRVATKIGSSDDLYTCVSKKSEAILIAPKESEEITIVWERMPGGSKNDMQLRDMFVSWENVFFSANTELLEKEELEFNWNESLTIEKNK
ncbi:MAG: hypothetical protein CVT95_01490 [Bacteroidetes bacterium HGW-Bacteroidetes-12]|nr:MAG: hypothetical protein CVT95_01490 [Bacteroidetes bacterium HGW-Bacteroidetes-12]